MKKICSLLCFVLAASFLLTSCSPYIQSDPYDVEITEDGDVVLGDTADIPSEVDEDIPSDAADESSDDEETSSSDGDDETKIEDEDIPSSDDEDDASDLDSEDTDAEDTDDESQVTEDENDEPQLPADTSFSVHFIDVGQADAALVECDGHYMLIDGGNKADSNIIYSVLKRSDIKNLDIVVGTHAHEDHIGGIPGAFSYATADLTLCPVTSYTSEAFKDFAYYAEKKGGGIKVPSVGDSYSLGSATVTIVGVNSLDDTNNTSVVLRIVYGNTSFLFTGDVEREGELVILNSKADISATVLKVAHHGSDSSTTYGFLREVMPEYAIISVGSGNTYGHPTDDVLSRLRDADVEVYRTDLQGDILVTSDGNTVSVTPIDPTASAVPDVETDIQIEDDDAETPGMSDMPDMSDAEVESESEDADPAEDPVSSGIEYVLNTKSMKFHFPSCSSAESISDENRAEYTGTREELLGMGYDPCGRCDP